MALSPAPGAYFRDWWPNSGGSDAAGADAGAGDDAGFCRPWSSPSS